jgi:hypothetical protein
MGTIFTMKPQPLRNEPSGAMVWEVLGVVGAQAML